MRKLHRIFTSHMLLFIACIYLFSRLLFLTRLPIFNDEAIYLDWGWREIHTPGSLFYSLIDGKQPFFMWLFGIAESIFTNQLFAGRLISVIAGLFSLIGIFKITETYVDKKTAIIASLLYISIPIFVAYDRLSLMESGISAFGIWSLFFLLRFLATKRQKDALILGAFIGIGFFIKSSMLIFLVTSLCLLVWNVIRKKDQAKVMLSIFTITGVFVLVNVPLFFQPMYWKTLSMNSRYSLTFAELMAFPIIHFLQNFLNNLIIIFIFITPIVTLLSLFGMIKGIKISKHILIILLWFGLSFLIQNLVVRSTTQRYVVSYLLPFSIFAAIGLQEIAKKYVKLYPVFLVILLFLPILMSMVQSISPVQYVRITDPITKQTESGLVYGQVSGYGISEIVSKINDLSRGQQIAVATAINIGNPENAIATYFHHSENIHMIYLDRRLFGTALNEYKCLVPQMPVYYISRDQQQSDMNTYFEEIYRYPHPYSNYSLGIYRFKKDCSGKSITFNPLILTR